MRAGWMFKLVRGIVNSVYIIALGFSLAWTIDGRGVPFPFAAAALTTAYGILMMLLWLHERYPSRQ